MSRARAQHVLDCFIPRVSLALFVAASTLAGCPDDPVEPPLAGTQWTEIEAIDTGLGAIMSGWGPAADTVYLVGGQPELGQIWRGSGDAFETVAVPSGPMLYWVHGADERVWVVGEQGRILRSDAGTAFLSEDTPTELPLWGVWAASAEEAWSVGGDPRDLEGEPVMLHLENAVWREVALPVLDRPSAALFKVWGTDSNNVFAVGSGGVLLHYDGTEWVQQLIGTSDDLISLWGRSGDDIVVVGGRSNGLLARWNGTSWESRILAGLPGLNGVWMDDNGVVTLVGTFGSIAVLSDGDWAYSAEDSPTSLTLHAIWGDSAGSRYAVGGSLNSNPPFTGVGLENR